MTVEIRPAEIKDAPGIALTLAELGADRYIVSACDIERRLATSALAPDTAIYVAAIAGYGVIGICHVMGVHNLSTEGYAEVMELAVQTSHQRCGTGRRLLEVASQWAIQNKFSRLRLRSGTHRTDAHLFYEKCGFARFRASYAFEISL